MIERVSVPPVDSMLEGTANVSRHLDGVGPVVTCDVLDEPHAAPSAIDRMSGKKAEHRRRRVSATPSIDRDEASEYIEPLQRSGAACCTSCASETSRVVTLP